MKHLVEVLIVLVVAALVIRFVTDLLSPALPLLLVLAAVGLVARWMFVRRNRW